MIVVKQSAAGGDARWVVGVVHALLDELHLLDPPRQLRLQASAPLVGRLQQIPQPRNLRRKGGVVYVRACVYEYRGGRTSVASGVQGHCGGLFVWNWTLPIALLRDQPANLHGLSVNGTS